MSLRITSLGNYRHWRFLGSYTYTGHEKKPPSFGWYWSLDENYLLDHRDSILNIAGPLGQGDRSLWHNRCPEALESRDLVTPRTWFLPLLLLTSHCRSKIRCIYRELFICSLRGRRPRCHWESPSESEEMHGYHDDARNVIHARFMCRSTATSSSPLGG